MSDRLPSFDLLKGFEAVARHLSFTKAAAELFVTQSAVSRQVRQLEEHLGVRLFENEVGSRSVRPLDEQCHGVTQRQRPHRGRPGRQRTKLGSDLPAAMPHRDSAKQSIYWKAC